MGFLQQQKRHNIVYEKVNIRFLQVFNYFHLCLCSFLLKQKTIKRHVFISILVRGGKFDGKDLLFKSEWNYTHNTNSFILARNGENTIQHHNRQSLVLGNASKIWTSFQVAASLKEVELESGKWSLRTMTFMGHFFRSARTSWITFVCPLVR